MFAALVASIGLGKILTFGGVLIGFVAVWLHGNATGTKTQAAKDVAVVQNAQSDAKQTVVDSEVANQAVVEAAAQKSADIAATVKTIDAQPIATGDAQKQLLEKYSRD